MRFEQVSNQTMSLIHRQIINAEALLLARLDELHEVEQVSLEVLGLVRQLDCVRAVELLQLLDARPLRFHRRELLRRVDRLAVLLDVDLRAGEGLGG